MNSISIENIWNFIQESNLQIDVISGDLLCLICHQVVMDARISVCGCRFCYKCITKHLETNSICPGTSSDCQGVILTPGLNLTTDYATIKNVLQLKVQCPQTGCTFVSELKAIEAHSRSCRGRRLCCTYLNVGCEESFSDKRELDEHLGNNHSQHLELILEIIGNLKNESKCSNDESITQQTRIDQLEQQIKETNEKLTLFTLELAQKSADIAVLDTNQKHQMECLFSVIEDVSCRFKALSDTLSAQMMQLSQNNADQLNRVESESTETRNQMENLLQIHGRIIWRISGFSLLKRLAGDRPSSCVVSETFYTKRLGYKLQLELWCDGWKKFRGRGLSVFVDRVMDGRERSQASSVELEVHLGLWNAEKCTWHAAKYRRIVFRKYSKNPCQPINFSLEEMGSVPVVNDYLVLKCSVEQRPSSGVSR